MLSRSSDWTTKSVTIVDRPVPVSVTFTKNPEQKVITISLLSSSSGSTFVSYYLSASEPVTTPITVEVFYDWKEEDDLTGNVNYQGSSSIKLTIDPGSKESNRGNIEEWYTGGVSRWYKITSTPTPWKDQTINGAKYITGGWHK